MTRLNKFNTYFICLITACMVVGTSSLNAESVGPILICDTSLEPRAFNRNKQFATVNPFCECINYSVSSSCNSQTGEITFQVTRDFPALAQTEPVQPLIQECLAFPLGVKIQDSTNTTVLGTSLNLNIGESQNLIVSGASAPYKLYLNPGQNESGEFELTLTHSEACVPPTTPSPSPTFTSSPSPEPTPGCFSELVCGIEGQTQLACNSEVSSIVVSAQPQPEGGDCECNDCEFFEQANLASAVFSNEIQYSWSYNCLDSKQATVSSGNQSGTSTLQVDLTAPGLGMPTTCEISLQVTRGEESISCSVPAEVSACILDCNNEINGVAAFDACGECGGNNDSCGTKACETENIARAQVTLDGSARAMARTSVRAGNYLTKIIKNKSSVLGLLKQAEAFYVRTWEETWSISSNILTCTSANALCSNVSMTSTVGEIATFGQDLFNLGSGIIDRIERKKNRPGHARVAKKLFRALNRSYSKFLVELAGLPSSQSVCTS